MQVRNQTYLRMKNKEDIINLLRKESRSYSELARILKLSNTAIGKIADDLIAKNLIKRESDTKGRTGITLSINADFGYVLAVDLSGKELNVCAANFKSEILMRRTISEVLQFERRDFDRVIQTMWEMVKSPLLADKRLCFISVASPGRFTVTGEILLNPRFVGFEGVSIKRVLEQTFGCDVEIKNDVNLAMIGEKEYGETLKEVSNALMFHVDVGTGAAIMLGGNVFEGNNGFAGEIGYFKLNMSAVHPDSFENLNYSNIYDSVSLFSCLAILKREVDAGRGGYLGEYVAKNNITSNEITIKNMVEAYVAGDALACRVVNAAGRVIGAVAGNIAEFMDIDVIVLNGAVVQLGEEFIKAVSENLIGKKVKYADLMDTAPIMGAVHVGLTNAFKNNF